MKLTRARRNGAQYAAALVASALVLCLSPISASADCSKPQKALTVFAGDKQFAHLTNGVVNYATFLAGPGATVYLPYKPVTAAKTRGLDGL